MGLAGGMDTQGVPMATRSREPLCLKAQFMSNATGGHVLGGFPAHSRKYEE
jgi:hypothetical protein